MDTNIIYKYRAFGASPVDDATITTVPVNLNPNEMLNLPHPIGEIVTLQADDPEEYGEAPKEYVVLHRFPILTQSSEKGFSKWALLIIVTDSDA
jgi:hypothetical protein